MGDKPAKSESGPPPQQDIARTRDIGTENIILDTQSNFLNRILEGTGEQRQQVQDIFTNIGQPIQDILSKLLQGELGAAQLPRVRRETESSLRQESRVSDAIREMISRTTPRGSFAGDRLLAQNQREFGVARGGIIPRAIESGIDRFAPLASDQARLLLANLGFQTGLQQEELGRSVDFNPQGESRFNQTRELVRQGNQVSTQTGAKQGAAGQILQAGALAGGLALGGGGGGGGLSPAELAPQFG